MAEISFDEETHCTVPAAPPSAPCPSCSDFWIFAGFLPEGMPFLTVFRDVPEFFNVSNKAVLYKLISFHIPSRITCQADLLSFITLILRIFIFTFSLGAVADPGS
jgi:hypothetical protein